MTPLLCRPNDLLYFRVPPLAEPLPSLQFQSLLGFSLADLGMLGYDFRASFPLIEEHPRLIAARETFDVPAPQPVEVTIERKPPFPRVQFLSELECDILKERFELRLRAENPVC